MSATFGATRLLAEIRALGHEAELVTGTKGHPFVVIDPFEVSLGRFAGRTIGLGLQATPDFPRTVASAIHVRSAPHLLECQDSVPKVRNIQPSELGAAWRYWSKNFGWTGESTARRLMSQINQIFKDA
jgi:hypothetical protein